MFAGFFFRQSQLIDIISISKTENGFDSKKRYLVRTKLPKKTFRRMTNQFWILPQHDEYLVYTHTLPLAPAISDMSRQFFTPNGQFLDPHPTYPKTRHHLSICTISAVHWIDGTHKGQLISEWNFGVFKKLGQKSVKNLVGFFRRFEDTKISFWD